MAPRIIHIDFSALKSLHLKGNFDMPGYPFCDFFNPQFEPDPALPDNIKVHSVISCENSTVCRASANDGSIELALKLGSALELVEEADAYDFLKENFLVGEAVPFFYGVLFERTKQRGIGCLITELWGSSLEREFYELPKAHKAIILQKLANIHAVGIIHNDFEPCNVLQKDGDFRIIDFVNFEEHECRQPKDFNFAAVGEHLDRKEAKKLCPNIRWIAHDMRLWEEGEVELHNGYFVKKSQHKLPDQHLIYQFPLPDRYHYVEFSRQEQWKLEFYLELRRQLDSGMSLEDLGKEENVAQRTAAAEEQTQIPQNNPRKRKARR
ncbi:hypothetical protein C8J56DRAFT_1167054 [Mycena floridula]|nr:hypothetical protein C8J56DRAFT_1167054 [Mycena floridula]